MESTTGISTSRESVRRLVDSAVEAPPATHAVLLGGASDTALEDFGPGIVSDLPILGHS
jgi:hypothetical protein